MKTTITPIHEVNQNTKLPASVMKVYESSLSGPTSPVATVMLLDPDGFAAAGVRLDKDQMLTLADVLFEIANRHGLRETLASERNTGYDDGYDDGNSEGWEEGYQLGYERGYDAAEEEVA